MDGKPHFSILATSFAGGPRPRNAALVLAGLWLVVFFCSLFAPPLLDDADATHAQAARAMAETGDLVTLRVDGVRYLEKAPLPYWLAAASFKVFGFNTFAAHLPQGLAVALLMLLGHRWANQAFGARTGYYTAISLLTSVGVFLFTRILIPEVLLSMLLGAALFAFLKALGRIAVPASGEPLLGEVSERPAVAWYAGPVFYPMTMWVSLALAVLTKGLVALVLFGGTAVAYLALTGEWRKARRLMPVSGIVVFLAIGAPWHVLAGLRNTGGADGHGFWWFYFWNEHVLRFLGRRVPMDYNQMPGWAFWGGQLVWLFPWSLFLPLGLGAIWRRFRHQTFTLARNANLLPPLPILLVLMFASGLLGFFRVAPTSILVILIVAYAALIIVSHRLMTGFTASPFERIDPQQKTILLLSLFAGVVLLFFSLSTNQEYYTFPAYLPILLLIAATITRAEQTYAFEAGMRRWVGVAHASFVGIGALAAVVLAWALWASRSRPYLADLGLVLAHRGVGNYTLSMSHVFDLTADAFAGLRLPAALAMLALAVGPKLAWWFRAQRRHIAATTMVAFTSAVFLVAAHLALVRFGTMLSSEPFAERILAVVPESDVLLYGDQAYGSSIPFYLGRRIGLVEGRSTSLWFGSTFADAPKLFETKEELRAGWGVGVRKVLFVPNEKRDEVDGVLAGKRVVVLAEESGKVLVTDREVGR